ncbi:MAG: hypothetical protein AAFV88_24750 [Planctomycetota bacterium]
MNETNRPSSEPVECPTDAEIFADRQWLQLGDDSQPTERELIQRETLYECGLEAGRKEMREQLNLNRRRLRLWQAGAIAVGLLGLLTLTERLIDPPRASIKSTAVPNRDSTVTVTWPPDERMTGETQDGVLNPLMAYQPNDMNDSLDANRPLNVLDATSKTDDVDDTSLVLRPADLRSVLREI